MVGHDDGRSFAPLRLLAALLLGGFVLAGCEGEEVRPLEPEGGEMFTSYVALGNSITAGFQSGGINDSTQQASYAAMVADAMGTEFDLPLMAPPGCPPPLVNAYTGEVVGGEDAPACLGRVTPPPTSLNNVAVPGAAIYDALHITGEAASPNELTTFILGGRTQVEAARQADPTFVSVALGSNDVLDAALTGRTGGITPPSTFTERYGATLDSLDLADAEGGVLIGVPDVTLIPHLSPGGAYWQAYQQDAFPPNFFVDGSCAPDQQPAPTLVPFGYAFGELIATAAARPDTTTELDCSADLEVLVPTEIQTIRQTVASYNAAIQEEASSRDWAYVSLTPTLESLRAEGRIPLFPNTSGPEAVSQPFGELFSKDGIHPARPLHRMLAELVIEAINAQYDTSLSPPGS